MELRAFACISDASDAECAARIEQEMETDRAREANLAASNSKLESNQIAAMFINALTMAANKHKHATAGK